MIARVSACSPARPHTVYSIQVHASMQLLTEIVDRLDSAQLMAACVVGIPSQPGCSKEAVDTQAAFAFAIRRSNRDTTEAPCAKAPRQGGHLPTGVRSEAEDPISWLTVQEF